MLMILLWILSLTPTPEPAGYASATGLDGSCAVAAALPTSADNPRPDLDIRNADGSPIEWQSAGQWLDEMSGGDESDGTPEPEDRAQPQPGKGYHGTHSIPSKYEIHNGDRVAK